MEKGVVAENYTYKETNLVHKATFKRAISKCKLS